MKDAQSAEQFRQKLETLKVNGLFRDQIPGIDPKKPIAVEISFLTSGNYLLIIGSKEWVDTNIESIRLMGYLFERPRAHLQLNLRVVQLTGPANAEVIQMAETVRALVDTQRDEIVRTFSELEDYLTNRVRSRMGTDTAVYQAVKELLPALTTNNRPLTVPEILMLLMLDRSSPAPVATAATGDKSTDAEATLMDLQRVLAAAARDPRRDDAKVMDDIKDELAAWKKTVTAARDWCTVFSEQLKKGKDGVTVAAFGQALEQPNTPIPTWVTRRMQRSLELTSRLYPNLVRRHTESSLKELERRFTLALERVAKIEEALAKGEMVPMTDDPKVQAAAALASTRVGHNLLALKTVADQLVPAPLALFETVAIAADNSAPTPEQLISMFREYTAERRKLEKRLGAEDGRAQEVNYAKLQALEASLNLWLRRVSEAMARSLETQFYRRYVNELRVLANKQLGKESNRDLLSEASIDDVPDVTRDLLLGDTGVNIFVTNSVSLQFAGETTNSVSAQVQAQLPSKQGVVERLQQAQQANTALTALGQSFGINGEAIIKSLLAGGQAVPVQSGINFTATPSVGFDASTVSLTLTASQTLQPNTDKVADRVTNHSINNATITALSYEPMVLSTLTSNVSYYEKSGGIPIIRKIPGIKDLAKDIPLPGFKEGKRQKGVYQSSVIILEPVVIPTIEDLVRFHGGWRDENAALAAMAEEEERKAVAEALAAKAAADKAAAAKAAMPAAAPAPAAPAEVKK